MRRLYNNKRRIVGSSNCNEDEEEIEQRNNCKGNVFVVCQDDESSVGCSYSNSGSIKTRSSSRKKRRRRIRFSLYILATSVMVHPGRAWMTGTFRCRSCLKSLASTSSVVVPSSSVAARHNNQKRRKSSITTALPSLWSMSADSRELRFYSGTSTLLKELCVSSSSFTLVSSSSSTYAAKTPAKANISRVATASSIGLTDGATISTTPEETVVLGGVGTISTTTYHHPKIQHFFSTKTTNDGINTNDAGESSSSSPNPPNNDSSNKNKPVATKVEPQHQQQRFEATTSSNTNTGSTAPSIELTDQERHLFNLLRRAREETHLGTTLRVAGGWVRDKLLATPEFQTYHKVFDVGNNGKNSGNNSKQRLTSKFQRPAASLGRHGVKVLVNHDEACSKPVDIDIALDDMLGREFAHHLNDYLLSSSSSTTSTTQPPVEHSSVGVVMQNPEKSKHLETATMKVGTFWIDFVNLRAEEYTSAAENSRIPDLMRIGTAVEDAYRRDLTINSLFYNINTGVVEDWTGRGMTDLRKGIVATPLAPLTTLLDDPLRVLRSIRFAARLRFQMDPELTAAAMQERVRTALAQKVSRERVGGEVDLMLRSPDPVGAMRLLITLRLADTVFPIQKYLTPSSSSTNNSSNQQASLVAHVLERGRNLLSVAYDYLADCRLSPPLWCVNNNPIYGGTVDLRLTEDDETRRLLWYAAFLKPLWDCSKKQQQRHSRRNGGRKANRSVVSKILVDDLKRPGRDAEAVEKIIKAADDFTQLVNGGCDVSATVILLSEIRVTCRACEEDKDHEDDDDTCAAAQSPEVVCTMAGRSVDSATEVDPVWTHAMEFRQLCSNVLRRVGPLWRASMMLSISEQLATDYNGGLDYTIEGDVVEESQEERRQGIIERFDAFAAALQQLGLIGICNQKPLLDGQAMKQVLPRIPKGPAFRDVMDEQVQWMVSHPGAPVEVLATHMTKTFPEFA